MAAASPTPLVALTAGEPAGIGPDLCALIARERLPGRLVIVGDARVIEERARLRSIAWNVPAHDSPAAAFAPVARLRMRSVRRSISAVR